MNSSNDKDKFDVCLIVAGQPATNPRTVKEAISLSNSGYKVCVIYPYSIAWADVVDKNIKDLYPAVKWKLVGGHPVLQRKLFFLTRVLFKSFKIISLFNKEIKKYTLSRASLALMQEAKKVKAKLYISHNLAALPAAATAARENKAVYSFDAEDYHRGQYPEGTAESKLVKRIEDTYIPSANFVSAASPLIAKQYKLHYPGIRSFTINNVFSIKYLCSELNKDANKEVLKLFWFSQTVSSGRGIESIITAMRQLADLNISFTILGNCSKQEKDRLYYLAKGFEHKIKIIPPVDEKELFSIASEHHVGLALEGDNTLNREICLTNKLFTYLLSGLAIIATPTPAQKLFLKAHASVGKTFEWDNNSLVACIAEFYNNPDLLHEYRYNSRILAMTKLNWEAEQLIYLKEIKRTLSEESINHQPALSSC